MEILEKVTQLRAELDALRPLHAEVEAKIWQKFRLDWNYHSNKLEGNTYSFGETKMLLLKGLTAGGKPIRDHEEITGHDSAINFILDSIKNDEPMSEVFIRHLHKLILVRPFHADAKTAEGKATKRLIKVGEYKTEPNHVETQTGEIFYFAEPIETPAKMQELVQWFRDKADSVEKNPILLAAEFHYRFVRIHPFDDGNGRLVCLLMNFVLMKYGYPPVIIKNEDKDNYIAVLEQADFAILEPFVKYIAENLLLSLDLMLKAAQGQEIGDDDDLDKELKMLEVKLLSGPSIDSAKSTESLLRIFHSTISPLILEFVQVCTKFNRFYSESDFRIYVTEMKRTSPLILGGDEAFSRLEKYFQDHLSRISLWWSHEGLNKSDVFDHVSSLEIDFGEASYFILQDEGKTVFQKSYSEDMSPKEIKELVRTIALQHKTFIDDKIEESKRLRPKS